MRRMLALTCAAGVALATAAPAQATTPGQNGRIVFSSNRTGSYQLYTIGSSGGGLRQVTHLDGDAVTPDWSPNGRWINLFTVQRDGTLKRERLVNMAQHNYVTGRGGVEPNGSITPDKKWVIFTGNFHGSRHVYAVSTTR